MKRIFTLFIFLFTFSTLFAQTLYTRKDTIAITQDSVTLQAGKFRGAIQWQYSTDKKTWNNLNGKIKETLKVIKSAEGYYRAEIIDGNCFSLYSDTALIKAGFSITKNVTAQTGGNITTPDNSTLAIPASALQTDGKVSISSVEENELPAIVNPNLQRYGDCYKLEIPGDTLLHSITLTFSLDSLPSPIENYILCLYDGSSYFPIEYTVSGNTVTAIIDNVNWDTSESLKKANLYSQLIITAFKATQTPPTYEMGLKEVHFSGGVITFSNPAAISDDEKVLLLIHGWNDKPQTWKNFVQKLLSQSDVKFSKIWTFGYNSSLSIDKNASELFQALANYTNGSKVKIVAHSMGGLVSRSMMELYGGSKYVKKLITLGTPHQGSPVAALRYYIGGLVAWESKSVDELMLYNYTTQGFRDLFITSDFIQRMKDIVLPPVPYYCIAGINPINLPFVPGLDDGVVSVESALGVPNTKGTAIFNINDILLSEIVAHNAMLRNENVFNKAKEYLIDQYTIKVIQGDNQVGIAGQKLPLPIIVQIFDEWNKPVKGEKVFFYSKYYSGDYSGVKTDEDGKVAVAWTLEKIEGTQTIEVYLKDDSGNKIDKTAVTITTESKMGTPTITTNAITNITESSASGGGNITDDGGGDVTARGICWNTLGTPTIADNKTSNGAGTGAFTSGLSGLTAGITYYVRAYASNSKGTGYGNQVSFKTTAAVTTAAITDITSTTATCGGTITSDKTITARGVCWNIYDNPTITENKTNDGSGTGSFTSSLTGLTANTTYYVRVYATSIEGTQYGSQVSFKTAENQISLPTVTTSTVIDITETSATCGGNVTKDGGGTIISRGVCWNTTGSPNINYNKTSDGISSGSFTSSLTGLTANSTYYVRAYATNSKGTSYGNQISFVAKCNCDAFTDSRDGHVYKTIKIGNQTWMAENLAYLPLAASPLNVESNNDPLYYIYDKAKYGVLYNWPAALSAAPTGWHLPSYDEWIELSVYLGGWSIAGGKMTSTNSSWPKSTNSSCFSALPGGYRYFLGGVEPNVNRAGWWTSTMGKPPYACMFYLTGTDFLYMEYLYMTNGFSIRCVKD